MKNNILEQIYIHRLEEYAPSAEYWALFKELDQLWAAAEPALGGGKTGELQDGESRLRAQSNYEWFREGWRMGTLLWLDLLRQSLRQ